MSGDLTFGQWAVYTILFSAAVTLLVWLVVELIRVLLLLRSKPMSESKETTDLVHPAAVGFKEKATPRDPQELFFFNCTCGHGHFRHAGYMKVMLPYLKPDNKKEMIFEDKAVSVCVKCKKAYVFSDGQVYDVTNRFDLAAWERTEKEAHKATGPGGQC